MMNFTITALDLPEVKLVTPRRFADSRGYFMETYGSAQFAANGIPAVFVQDNQAQSVARGTIRGLHFQAPPKAQAKLVRVVKGAIFDVAVDIRRGSPSYGKWCGATLTASGGEQLFVPHGFAHAYCTLEPDTEVLYKVDDYYAPASEGGMRWDDPTVGIDWPVEKEKAILSDKDKVLPLLADFVSPFV
jgi:dTDP-4-dehydrorhamnose 3,5-epimerase